MAVMALVAVKVKPFTVAACPAANALNTTVSVDFEVDPATNVDTGVADAEPEAVTTVGSADTASMAVLLMVRPETAAVDVDVAAIASVPIVQSMVKPLPAFNAVELAAKLVEVLRCALASEAMDTEWVPDAAPTLVVTPKAAVFELLTLLELKLLASLRATSDSFMVLSMKLTAE